MKNPLRSNLYVLAIIFLVFFGGINGCKKSGGGINNTDDELPPEPTKITSSFESEDTSFLPGQIQLINIKGYELGKDEYEAEIVDGTTITLYRYGGDAENKTLAFLVPEESSKDHTLLFTLEGQEQSLDFTINKYEVIENPKETVDSFFSKLSTDLGALYQNETDSEVRAFLQKIFDRVNEEIKKVEDLSEKEISLLARIIATNYSNYSVAQSKQQSYSKVVVCSDLKAKIIFQGVILITSVKYTLTSVSSIFVGGGLIAAVTGGISLGTFVSTLEYFWKNKREYKEACRQPGNSWLFEGNKKMKGSNIFNFNHGESNGFLIKTEYDLSDEDKSFFAEIRNHISKLSDILPNKWMSFISEEDVPEVRSESPAGFKIGSISDVRVFGSAAGNVDQLAITLEYQKGVILDGENTPFTFELVKEGYNQSITVEATLKPPIPIAHNKQVTVPKDSTSVIDTLNADYAADFIIENQPSNGTVTLDNVFTGEFTYQADEGYIGEDSFTFFASNNTGKSEISTINIEIVKGEPPVITNLVKSCTEDGEHIRLEVTFSDLDGPGFDPNGSYSFSPTDKSYSYPVRLQFQTEESGQWQLAANGYRAKLLSGTTKEGVIEVVLYIEGSKYTACRQSDYYNSDPAKFWYKWKLFLRELTDGNSNEIQFDLYYYGHVFG